MTTQEPDPEFPPDPKDEDGDLARSIVAAGAALCEGDSWRMDGWTPDRIATFLNTLAEWGNVSDAARVAGVSRQSAYELRNSARGRPFQLAWRAALLLARRRLADDLMSRAVNGQVDLIYRDGELWRERRRFDNRLALALLARLDRQAAEDEMDPAASRVADEFEQFVALVGEGRGAAAFMRHRAFKKLESMEAALLERSENFAMYGVGHPGEIEISDLPIDSDAGWTDEQIDRARRAGVLRPRRLNEYEMEFDPVPAGRTRYDIIVPNRGHVGTIDV